MRLASEAPRAAPACIERRTGERRVDKHRSRLVTRAFCLYRVFGLKTAISLMHRTGFDLMQARHILVDKYDRRRIAGPVRANASPPHRE
jgi:hypothetical protein